MKCVMTWVPDEADIRRRRAAGELIKDIAEIYGVPESTLGHWCVKNGIHGPAGKGRAAADWVPDADDIRRRRAAGEFVKDIAKAYGTTERAMEHYCRAHDIRAVRMPKPPKVKEAKPKVSQSKNPGREVLIDMRIRRRMTIAEIAEYFSVRKSTVVGWLGEADIRLPPALRPLPPVRQSKAAPKKISGTDMAALIAEAVAAGRVTRCPTAFAAPTLQASLAEQDRKAHVAMNQSAFIEERSKRAASRPQPTYKRQLAALRSDA